MTGGTSVKAFPVPPLPTLGELAEGTLVKMNESGAPVEFYVAKHDYESELNGAGRTLVVRKDVYDQRQWHSITVNAWASCTLREWLNGNYKGMLDADIQEAMDTTTYRYTPGNGDITVTTRADAVFLLSATELDKSESWHNVEGSSLPIASTLKIAYQNGSATSQWIRSPCTNNNGYAVFVNQNGAVRLAQCIDSYGSRPCFTLPSTVLVDENMNVIGGVA